MTPRAPAMTPDERRASIVDVTLPLLIAHGAALTTKQVAEAAGIAEGTVFRVFPTKDDLVHACATAVFDTTKVVARLRALPVDGSLDERLTAATAILQGYLERAMGLIVTLHASGVGPRHAPGEPPRRRSVSDPEVEAALVDLIGADAEGLRLPARDVVNVLANLTFSSSHPMFPTRPMSAAEIVSVVLDGTRKTGTC